MTAPLLPWIPAAIRAVLLADPAFAAACGGRCSTRAPSDVTTGFALVRATAIPINASAGAWSPLAQVDGYCAPGAGLDPEHVAWTIAAAAAARLDRVRNEAWLNIHYRARVVDGPIPGIDTSRGDDAPLYRCTVRAELAVHAR